jgi:hypothetical protein
MLHHAPPLSVLFATLPVYVSSLTRELGRGPEEERNKKFNLGPPQQQYILDLPSLKPDHLDDN